MSRNELIAVVQDVFRDVLGDEALCINESMSAADVDGWDSLTHIGIVSAIEKHYKIRFSLGELESLKNVGDLLGTIEAKLAR